jgi:polysaccharide export outer membrane protein
LRNLNRKFEFDKFFILKLIGISFVITFALGIYKPTLSQSIPDYEERSLALDTLFSQLDEIEATEGNINPDEYLVGPGDKLFLSISGLEEITQNLLINQEGQIYIPKVGGIDLVNTTLSDAKTKIKSAINNYYKDVDIFITLYDFRRIKVSLLGDVKIPSSYTLTANSRLIDLIIRSSGLTKTSNYRNIKIVSRDGTSKNYDLLSFFRFGDKSNNPFLREGDIVIVDRVDKVVTIYGLIKYPGIYEYIDGETVEELIRLAGGFRSKAKTDSIEVVTFENIGKYQRSTYYSYKELAEKKIKLNIQDQVIVREIPEYYIDRFVKVEGFVKYPGWYKIIKDQTTLTEIIHEAGGFLHDASLSEATITRTTGITENDPEFERLKIIPRADMTEDEYDYLKAKSRQRAGRVVVDFVELFTRKNHEEDVILKRGDVITIPEAKNYVILLGQVVNPGNVIYKEGLSIKDYIDLAGGFGWRAQEGDVRVIKVNTGEWIEEEDVQSLEPGDIIWIPEEPPAPKFWDVFATTLGVLGQVATVVAATVAVVVATK